MSDLIQLGDCHHALG